MWARMEEGIPGGGDGNGGKRGDNNRQLQVFC